MTFKEIKRHALDSLKGNWGIAILGALIASALGGIDGSSPDFNFSSGSGSSSTSGSTEQGSAMDQEQLTMLLSILIPIVLVTLFIALVMSVAFFIVGSTVGVGYAKFNLYLVDGIRPSIGAIFSYFRHLKTCVLAELFVTIKVTLGLLLFIVPGIIASYKYAMVRYILADNPQMSAREALYESARLMDGNKWRYFCFGLSFIGWALLVVASFGIASIWVVPYEQAAIAKFYREIKSEKSLVYAQ